MYHTQFVHGRKTEKDIVNKDFYDEDKRKDWYKQLSYFLYLPSLNAAEDHGVSTPSSLQNASHTAPVLAKAILVDPVWPVLVPATIVRSCLLWASLSLLSLLRFNNRSLIVDIV